MAESYSENLEALSPLEKQVLVERHLISREHAAKGVGSGVVMNAPQSLSFMINEEDHLRMQAICCGLQLTKVFGMINQADSELEELLEFAFHPSLGYLTACPTNVGTGMRASAMLHLPGLVMSDQMNKIINSVNKIGLAVRGLHGEGTGGDGEFVPGFEPDDSRRGRGGDHRATEQSDHADHRARAECEAGAGGAEAGDACSTRSGGRMAFCRMRTRSARKRR